MAIAVQDREAIDIPFLSNGVVDWENDPLASVLLKEGKLKGHELQQITSIASARVEALGIALVRYGLLSETDLAAALSEMTGLSVLGEERYLEATGMPEKLAPRFLKSACIVPLSWTDSELVLVMAEPRDRDTLKSIAMSTGLRVVPRLGVCSHIQAALDRLSGIDDEKVSHVADEDLSVGTGVSEDSIDVAHLRDLASEAPTIRTVNNILQEAISLRASDIHFEPGDDGMRVRYRVDGVLREGSQKFTSNAAAINSRIKIMARLDIAERRLPQDGRIQIKVTGKELDIRVSTVPTLFGESIVIRILDKSNVVLDFEHLGFRPEVLQQFRKVLSVPDGIFLVTGPTGSGKTTTLYTGLNQINSVERKLITVEDPVEYQLPGINQIPIQPKIGLTFDKVLRSILRQDPDVIMVGEMRDLETARIAVQAALTGHLVLSTLHTNDAVTGITRLLDMGVEDYLVNSTLNGVLAQRLVRRLCTHCRQPSADRENEYRAVGCEHCSHTGFRGRIAITEFLLITDRIRSMILGRVDRGTLKAAAMEEGMSTLYESGMRLVQEGVTTRTEVLRAASAD